MTPERKAQLDALPRCEVPGCGRRGTWRCGDYGPRVLLCGRHRRAAATEYHRAHAGYAWLPGTPQTRDAILAWADK